MSAQKHLQFSIPVSIIKDGNAFVAYTPALDISTCAASIIEAKRQFAELIEIFFEELEEQGTTTEVLESLGWQKVQSSWIAPQEVEHSIERFQVSALA